VTKERGTLAILAFHKIGEPSPGNVRTWFYVPEATFAGYLCYLRDHNWTVLDLTTFLHGLSSPDTLPQRAALLTFDDGYRSVLDVALPWLQRFKFPAVTFVPTAFVGDANAFDADEPHEPICDWDALRSLEAAGVAVQSHGVSHRAFSSLTSADQEQELRESKRLLEQELGRPVETFAYPYGDPGSGNGSLDALLERAGYRAACVFKNGPFLVPATDRYRLTRVAMGPDTDLGRALAIGADH
jgi:peptidoglycan/xylan/chitin deacetylase (PgdA/CDA1 family)